MSLIYKIEKKYFFTIIIVLFLITCINYSEIKVLETIRMNNFFSGFIAGLLISLLLAGIVNYPKFKK